eukprot:gene30293-35281_t
MSIKKVLWLGALLRLLLLLWGEVQDATMDVKYTDIDYKVFTEAATFVYQGQSPFNRNTYRYSPLLAYAQGVAHRRVVAATALWLFNPFTLTISTRGSCDVLVVVMLLAVLWSILRGQRLCAALIYGLAVHFRIYPIIYAPSLVLFLANRKEDGTQSSKVLPSIQRILFEGISFGLQSGGCFLLLGWASYGLYGQTFLEEAFLYHLSRRDPRHNFSPYFYPIYLYSYGTAGGGLDDGAVLGMGSTESPSQFLEDPLNVATHTGLGTGTPLTGASLEEGLAPSGGLDVAAWAFLPPLVLMSLLALRYSTNLPLCWLLQTWVFVTFNKVVTAQYFVWYFSLLPLVLPHMHWPPSPGLLVAGSLWVVTQLHWLGWGYLLEFKGLPVHLYLWAAGLLFLMANANLIVQIMHACRSARPFQVRLASPVRSITSEGRAPSAMVLTRGKDFTKEQGPEPQTTVDPLSNVDVNVGRRVRSRRPVDYTFRDDEDEESGGRSEAEQEQAEEQGQDHDEEEEEEGEEQEREELAGQGPKVYKDYYEEIEE